MGERPWPKDFFIRPPWRVAFLHTFAATGKSMSDGRMKCVAKNFAFHHFIHININMDVKIHHMTDRHLIRTSTNVLCVKDGKVLLSRRQNTGWADGKLTIPGGHVEAGETPRQAAVRELEEELGLKISEEDLQFYCVAQRNSDQAEYVAYEFQINLKPEQTPKNTEPELCSELVWAEVDNLPEDLIKDFSDIITQGYIQSVTYLELGF